MAVYPYRNESLIQMETYHTDPARADLLVNAVRAKWATLREQRYAGDYPVELLRSAEGNGTIKIVEIFKWNSGQAKVDAQRSSTYEQMCQEIAGLTLDAPGHGAFTQVVRGFNKNFPPIGGVELLKGVCSCLLSVDGIVQDYQMSVKNGIVLMHRSPRADIDGDGRNEMYLKILMHGGEQVQAALGPVRVEQNFQRPNDGIVKSDGVGDADFPATAIWRVSWRIQTALGPVLTDPDTPLIFGPARVQHYPPVGTHFHSPTGPVKLIHEQSGKQVGTLVPGELTAFDIVISKDDEIYADILNAAPDAIFQTLEAHRHLLNETPATAPASIAATL